MRTIAKKIDWFIIKEEYVTTEIGYEELAKKHQIRRNTLCERAAKEEWVKQRARYREDLERKTAEEIAKKKAKQKAKDAVKVNKVCDKLLKRISSMAEKVVTAKELKALTSALGDIQKLKGIKSDEDKQEQEARIKALLHSIEKDTDKGHDAVKVIIEGAEEYAE